MYSHIWHQRWWPCMYIYVYIRNQYSEVRWRIFQSAFISYNIHIYHKITATACLPEAPDRRSATTNTQNLTVTAVSSWAGTQICLPERKGPPSLDRYCPARVWLASLERRPVLWGEQLLFQGTMVMMVGSGTGEEQEDTKNRESKEKHYKAQASHTPQAWLLLTSMSPPPPCEFTFRSSALCFETSFSRTLRSERQGKYEFNRVVSNFKLPNLITFTYMLTYNRIKLSLNTVSIFWSFARNTV